MIIDNHVHLFPDQAGTAGYPDVEAHGRELQKKIGRLWRDRMVTSHTDPRYIPEPDEDVGFQVGLYGKWHWTKHGEACWMLRGPVMLEDMVHTPEHMLAHMDSVCVDMAVLEGGYMEPNYERERSYPRSSRSGPTGSSAPYPSSTTSTRTTNTSRLRSGR